MPFAGQVELLAWKGHLRPVRGPGLMSIGAARLREEGIADVNGISKIERGRAIIE
jgi:hypothetical protein